MQFRHTLAPFLLRAPEPGRIGFTLLIYLFTALRTNVIAPAQGMNALPGRCLVRDTDQSLVCRHGLCANRESRDLPCC